MYKYEHCKNMVEALTNYQSNVRLILISDTDGGQLRHDLFINDQEFLAYVSGRLKDVDGAANPEIQ